jgi:hypothetical protein
MFEINEEVIVDNYDCGLITFVNYNDHENYYVVESEMTGSTYHIYDENRLESVNV